MKAKTFILSFLVITLFCSSISGQIKTLKNGDKISWDGEYYDFRDSAGIKMIKIWIPPGIKTVKGVFISGHGGGGGDSRNFARDENIRAFAARLGFAVAGLHNFPGRRVYNDGAPVFFKALEAFSEMGNHPEMSNLPFVMYGSSNGGASTYGFVNYAPERAICFVSNVGSGGNPQTPVDGALKVPGIFIVGKFDALMGDRAINRTKELINYARPKGGLWSWAMELKGHEDGFSFDIYMKLVEQAVKVRYPSDGDPAKGPIKLIEVKEEEGWLIDHESWDSGLTYVDSYSKYTGDKTKAGWILNKDLAFVYRSLATHHNPLTLKVLEFDRTFNPNTDPGTMFSLGGPVADPGELIRIKCAFKKNTDWKKIEIFNGSKKLGEAKAGDTPVIETSLDLNEMVYCLTALVTNKDNTQSTCDPMHFFINDPSISWKSDSKAPSYTAIKSNKGSRNKDRVKNPGVPNPEDSILISYALSGEMEAQFSSSDGDISEFWSHFDEKNDFIRETQRKNATRDASFNMVLTHDCNMNVKSAYGADGLYMLIEINDDNDVAWPNQFSGTENEQFYLNFDVVDLMIDSRSISEISDPANKDMFVSRSFGLTSSTRQYQVACGTPKMRPTGFKRAKADPWDFYGKYYTFEQAQDQFGIQIENIKTDYFFKVQEWFIPWSEVGAGLNEEPAAGNRIAFTCGYNDRDEGEHFPPGVTSSGGSVKASNALRWINKSDPWGSNKSPYNWGEIEFGPGLK